MATKWIKLSGSAATKFDDQYQDMLAKNEVTEREFPPEMFVEFMLDIRSKAQEIANKQEGAPDGGQTQTPDQP